MELWDLYDREGKPTGETFERTHGSYLKIPEGRYHLVCDILVKHVDGTYLLTKRHMSKDVYPGYWEASAGGSAVSGEDPITCAKRELFEETGIVADEFTLISHTFRDKSHSMFYSYLVVTDCPKDSVVLQEGETTEYKWVDVAGLLEYVDSDLAIKTHNARYATYFEKLRMKTVGIVSLSSGIIGEDFVQYEVEIGVRRLQEFGLNVKFMPHAKKGLEYVKEHPEKRAEDLLEAFRDPEIDIILCAIGGDDTYRLLPYLFEKDELAKAATQKPFLGFSDTTINHFMLHKVGLRSFYGQAFLCDLCELGPDMLPYTKKYFEEFITTGSIREVRPSEVWYGERKVFAPDQVGVALPSKPDRGFELLQGSPTFSGEILGGCIDSMYDMFNGDRYADMPVLCEKYQLFPGKEDWSGRILLLESSEEKPSPENYRQSLLYLKERGLFEVISGVLAGKPMDETYAEEYKKALVEVIDDPKLPIVFNLNIGHALPRCILPFGVKAMVDASEQVIRFEE